MLETILDRVQARSRDILRSSTHSVSTCEPSSDLLDILDLSLLLIHFDILGPTTHSYEKPPLGDVTIEEFELFAIDRLRVLGEIESSWARNRPLEELKQVVGNQCGKYVPLGNNTASTIDLDEQRRKDHIGHFVLRLAFCRS
jgi:hypothetical protein